jgi:hypothetical protein
MSTLFAMTLPALVVILVVAGVIDVLATRRRRRRGATAAKPKVATAAIDVLGLAFSPGSRHKLEHDQFMELDRDEEGDAAPPRSRVDLDAGTARIVLPSSTATPIPEGDPETPADDDSGGRRGSAERQ